MRKKKEKKKGGKPLTLRERSIIEIRWCFDFKLVSDIAAELDRNRSTISREIGGRPRKGRGRYDADKVHREALDRIGNRGNRPKTKKNPGLKAYIEQKITDEGWSPEQVSIRLPHEYPDDKDMRISHETIYQDIYRRVHRRGNGKVKKGELDLRPHLARRHKRRAKKGFRKAQKAQRRALLPSIEDRPKEVEKRSRVGDWEDDTMVSRATKERIKSLTERKSGVAIFGKTTDGTAEKCDEVVLKRLSALPRSTRKTLTRDRGSENVNWRDVSSDLDMDVFFAHPYSSFERGTNENTNGLFRRYFPKKTDWSKVSNEDVKRVERLLNTRPRKRHGGLTPEEVFYMETGVALYS